MLKENLQLFFNRNAEIFFQKHVIVFKSVDEDAVHQMRVSLKRINTLSQMLIYRNKAGFKLKRSLKLLRKLFKRLGPIRDFQVQALLVEDFKHDNFLIDQRIINKLIDKKNHLMIKFLKTKKTFGIFKLKRAIINVEKIIQSIDNHKLESIFDEFENSRIVKLQKFSTPSNKGFNLHKTRKIIKDLSYLIEMCNPENSDVKQKLSEYKESGHILGDWHDRVVSLNFLDELKKPDSGIGLAKIEQFESTIILQREILKEEFLSLLKDWK